MGNFFTRIRERSFALALTVAAVLTFGALAAAPATAVEEDAPTATAVAESLTISGTVTGETPDGAVPVGGAHVSVSDSQGNVSSASTTTDIDGHYVLTGLTSDIDILSVFEPYSQGGFGFLDSPYTGVNLNGADITADIVLKQGSKVSGVVSKNVAGVTAPAKGIDVTVLAAVGDSWSIDWARTASDGSYSVGSLPAGNYKVSFGVHGSATGLNPVYYDNASTRATATVIAVPEAGEVSSINATLVPDGTPFPVAGEPVIAGVARAGETLAVTGSWVPSNTELTYEWYRYDGFRGTVVGTSSTYAITKDDVASTLSVYVTGSATGFLTKSFGSGSTATVLPAKTTSPSPTPSPTPTPRTTPTPTAEPATETGDSTPASVVGPKSDRVTTPAATLVAGASIPITGEGFKPFEVVDIWMHSTPVLLGTLTADAQGRISGSFAMPAGLATGTHHVVLVDEAGVSYTSAELVVTTTATLASTGSDLSSGWLALALMVLGGLALTVTARRRTASALK